MHDLIESRFDALSPELQRAARWVQAHPADVGLQSMRECARRARVAPATMTRLAQALGLPGFEALREPFRERLAQGDGYVARARSLQRARTRAPQWLATLSRLQQGNAASVDAADQRSAIEAAARSLLASRRVAFLGLRASYGIAYQLHYSYQLLAANGTLLGDLGGALQDQLDQLSTGEMLVAVSLAPYTRRTVQAVEQCAARGVAVLALTDSALSPIARAGARGIAVSRRVVVVLPVDGRRAGAGRIAGRRRGRVRRPQGRAALADDSEPARSTGCVLGAHAEPGAE